MDTSGPFPPENQVTFFDFQKRAVEASPIPPTPSHTPVNVTEYTSTSLNIPKYP